MRLERILQARGPTTRTDWANGPDGTHARAVGPRLLRIIGQIYGRERVAGLRDSFAQKYDERPRLR